MFALFCAADELAIQRSSLLRARQSLPSLTAITQRQPSDLDSARCRSAASRSPFQSLWDNLPRSAASLPVQGHTARAESLSHNSMLTADTDDRPGLPYHKTQPSDKSRDRMQD